ncbi:Aldo/keto reductase [Lophiostoma macrostomum CBS 122681]|uniref:Aldo/keto reductase n=1 Tax=Lophiostoma macrostomum CBS 122681 TaxID=1314788 RepID=A0A6A6TF16_9PLEO|nr:Aldo/keto reductase [Lophiostoma macrostomum CBS 122681]
MPKLVGKEVGPIGFGLMGLTWRAKPQPAEKSIEAMKTALSLGANAWNGGEFYGTPEYNSLHLLNQYFTKYPEDADKVVLSIKGGAKPGQVAPDGSRENVRRSIDECLKLLDGKKSLDLFECARVDPNTRIEDTISYIAEYVKEGKLGGISLSEVSAKSIRRAHKVHPISAVEVEISLWATEPLENGIATTCAELGIPVIAYSPLGRGLLTGHWKTLDDLPEDSPLRGWPRFTPESFPENVKLVEQVEKIAQKKGVTPAQIAVGWVLAQSRNNGFGDLIPIPGATTPERIKENMQAAQLDSDDLAALGKILQNFTPVGGRYPDFIAHLSHA